MMPEFVSHNPDAKVRGSVFMSYLLALGDEARPYAEKRGFGKIDPDTWYNYQESLELLKELSMIDMHGTFDLVKVGMRACEIVMQRFPCSSVGEYLLTLSQSQAAFFDGLDASQWWQIEVLPNHVVARVSTFTGCDFSYGYLYVAVRNLRPADTLFSVTHRDGSCRKNGDEYCVYDVKWWEDSHESDDDQW